MMEAKATVREFLRTSDVRVYNGTALELAQSIYRNEDLPLRVRMAGMALALPFESPRLTAVAVMRKDMDPGVSADFGKLVAQMEKRLALYSPDARTHLIEHLRSGDGETEAEETIDSGEG